MAWVVAIDGMGRCHRWYRCLPSMAWVLAFDGMGACHRWYWVLPPMPWVMPSMLLTMAINGVPRRRESCQSLAPASTSQPAPARYDATDDLDAPVIGQREP